MEKRKVPTVPVPKKFKGEWRVGSDFHKFTSELLLEAGVVHTLEEAQEYARDLFDRWLLTVAYLAVEVPEGEE